MFECVVAFGVTGSMMVSAHIHQAKRWRFATLNNL